MAAGDITFGSEYTILSGSSTYGYVKSAWLDSTHIAIVYSDYVTDGFKTKVGTVSGTTISWGSEVIVVDKNNDDTIFTSSIDIAVLDSTHYAVTCAYYDYGFSQSYILLKGYSVSGTTVSAAGSTLVHNNSGNNSSFTNLISLDSDKLVVAYRMYDSSNTEKIRYYTYNGSSFTSKTVTDIPGNQYIGGHLEKLSSTSFIFTYEDYDSPVYYLKTLIGEVTSSNMTLNTSYTVLTGHVTSFGSVLLDSTHLVTMYRTSSSTIYGKLGTISGTTISYGSEQSFTLDTDRFEVMSVDDSGFYIFYSDYSDKDGYYVRFDVDGSTITMGTPARCNSTDSTLYFAFPDYHNGKVVLGQRYYTSSSKYLTTSIGEVEASTVNEEYTPSGSITISGSVTTENPFTDWVLMIGGQNPSDNTGLSGPYYYSIDGGNSWTSSNVGATDKGINYILKNNYTAYANFGGGGTFYQTWNGVNWSSISGLESIKQVGDYLVINDGAGFYVTKDGVTRKPLTLKAPGAESFSQGVGRKYGSSTYYYLTQDSSGNRYLEYTDDEWETTQVYPYQPSGGLGNDSILEINDSKIIIIDYSSTYGGTGDTTFTYYVANHGGSFSQGGASTISYASGFTLMDHFHFEEFNGVWRTTALNSDYTALHYEWSDDNGATWNSGTQPHTEGNLYYFQVINGVLFAILVDISTFNTYITRTNDGSTWSDPIALWNYGSSGIVASLPSGFLTGQDISVEYTPSGGVTTSGTGSAYYRDYIITHGALGPFGNTGISSPIKYSTDYTNSYTLDSLGLSDTGINLIHSNGQITIASLVGGGDLYLTYDGDNWEAITTSSYVVDMCDFLFYSGNKVTKNGRNFRNVSIDSNYVSNQSPGAKSGDEIFFIATNNTLQKIYSTTNDFQITSEVTNQPSSLEPQAAIAASDDKIMVMNYTNGGSSISYEVATVGSTFSSTASSNISYAAGFVDQHRYHFTYFKGYWITTALNADFSAFHFEWSNDDGDTWTVGTQPHAIGNLYQIKAFDDVLYATIVDGSFNTYITWTSDFSNWSTPKQLWSYATDGVTASGLGIITVGELEYIKPKFANDDLVTISGSAIYSEGGYEKEYSGSGIIQTSGAADITYLEYTGSGTIQTSGSAPVSAFNDYSYSPSGIIYTSGSALTQGKIEVVSGGIQISGSVKYFVDIEGFDISSLDTADFRLSDVQVKDILRISSTKFIVAYTDDNGNNYDTDSAWVICGEISGGEISYGSPVVILGDSTAEIKISNKLNGSTFVCAMADMYGTLVARSCSVSGTTITRNSFIQNSGVNILDSGVSNIGISRPESRIYLPYETRTAISYVKGNDTYVCMLNGYSSFEGIYLAKSNMNGETAIECVDSDNVNRFVLFYGNGTTHYVGRFTYTPGSSFTENRNNTFYSGSVNNITTQKLSDSEILVSYNNGKMKQVDISTSWPYIDVASSDIVSLSSTNGEVTRFTPDFYMAAMSKDGDVKVQSYNSSEDVTSDLVTLDTYASSNGVNVIGLDSTHVIVACSTSSTTGGCYYLEIDTNNINGIYDFIYPTTGSMAISGSAESGMFYYTGSGTIETSGAADTFLHLFYTPTGGINISGSADSDIRFTYTPTGGIETSGGVDKELSIFFTSSGEITISGQADSETAVQYTFWPTGGIITSGSASSEQEHDYFYSASGSAYTSGGASYSIYPNFVFYPTGIRIYTSGNALYEEYNDYDYSMSGGVTISGAAFAYLANDYIGSGTVAILGSATYEEHTNDYLYSPSGVIQISGSGEYDYTWSYFYLPTGGITISGDAAEIEINNYEWSGSGIVTISGDATYVEYNDYPFSPSGTITISGECASEYSIGRFYTGSGIVTISGECASEYSIVRFYTGSGIVTISGDAAEVEYNDYATYTPSGSITLSGSAQIARDIIEEGSGSIIIFGEATLYIGVLEYVGSGIIEISGVTDHGSFATSTLTFQVKSYITQSFIVQSNLPKDSIRSLTTQVYKVKSYL